MQNTAVRCYEPEVHDPYPHRKWNRIWRFSYESDLHLLRLRRGLPGTRREAQYIVAKPYLVSFKLDDEGVRRNITVPKGMLTDLASVPRPLRWYAGRVGPHLEAAVVHDFLYVAWQDLGMLPTGSMRRFADRIMLRQCWPRQCAARRMRSTALFAWVAAARSAIRNRVDMWTWTYANSTRKQRRNRLVA